MDATAIERWEPDLSQVRIGDLPASYREVADLIGLQTALQLVKARGGGKLAVPARPQPGHPLAEELGRDAWAALCSTYRGLRLDVPSVGVACRPARDRDICAAYWQRRIPASDLARRYGLAERTVQVIVSASTRAEQVTGQ